MLYVQELVETALGKISGNEVYKDFANEYWYCDHLEKNAILFIGINPSSQPNCKKIERHILAQDDETHPYFKRFREIAEETGLPWTHTDLFFFRKTKQKEIDGLLKKAEGKNFLKEQLDISGKILGACEPKVIVISNALAASFFGVSNHRNKGVCLNINLVFDEEIGTFRWNNIPVFVCSMLTGQRALDNGSYKRLKWHIKYIISKENLHRIEYVI